VIPGTVLIHDLISGNIRDSRNEKIIALVVVAKEGLLQVFGFYIKLVAECFLLL